MSQQMLGLTIDSSTDGAHVPHTQGLSSPINLHSIDLSSLDSRDIQAGNLALHTPLPTSPDERERESAKSFFGHCGPSQSAGRIRDEASVSAVSMDGSVGGRSSSTSPWRNARRNMSASSPVRSNSHEGTEGVSSSTLSNLTLYDKEPSTPTGTITPTLTPKSTSASSIPSATPPSRLISGERAAQPQPDPQKANKKRLQMLSRSKSLRVEDEMKSSKKMSARKAGTPQASSSVPSSELHIARNAYPLPEKDRSFRDLMKSSRRDRSEDRIAESDEDRALKSKQKKKDTKDKQEKPGHPKQGQHNSSNFFTDLRSTSAAGLGKGKGILSNLGSLSEFSRSGSTHEKTVVPAGDHVTSVLNLPLIQQTRVTRIAKSYDHCKDKTEFWMPALPWRCIDYLNGKCEEEGLYRISGGITQVKEWRKRFDTELDVNLLDETELYDPSVIASLFKEWIRELPEDIFPKDAQERVSARLPRDPITEEHSVSQLLRDELQHLPPFNYYLLFAITCHLSLLLSYESKNKMNLDNLYRCFNQSLKLDGRIFYTLVGDWRQCWAGCVTENDYLRAEYDHLQHPYPQFIRDNDDFLAAQSEERAVSSSGSSAPPATGIFTPELQRPATSNTQPSHSAEEGEDFWLTPMKRAQRSSSDVTGLSPLKGHINAGAPHET